MPDREKVQRRLTSIASVVILIIIFATPAIGLVWLRAAVVREREHNALWHSQTMLIRHLVRTRGGWPKSWDDLEEDFEPTNHSRRSDRIDTLKELVTIDFEQDPSAVDLTANDEPPSFLALKSGAQVDETTRANMQLLKFIGKIRERGSPSP